MLLFLLQFHRINSYICLGMYILQNIPEINGIDACPFVLGSRKMFEDCMAAMRSFFKEDSDTLRLWNEWDVSSVPQNDSVREHLML